MIRTIKKRFEFAIHLAKANLTAKQFIFLAAVLVGISVTAAVIILKTFAHKVFEIATYLSSKLHLSFVNGLLPIIGILLTVLVVKKLLGGSIEKGTSQILYAVAKKAGIVPRKQMYAQIMTSSLTVGLGGSAGLESPIVITGAAFGSNFAQQYRLGYKERTLLIGCGVAAGIAAAFKAPIAGVLFAIEVLLVDVSIAAFTPIMISAATGAILSAIILDDTILLTFNSENSFNYKNVPYYVGLGLITGFVSVFYMRNFQRVERIFGLIRWKPYKKALIGSSLLAILIFVFPPLFGEGYEGIRLLSADKAALLLEGTLFESWENNKFAILIFVGLILFTKVFATGLTIGSGGNGGNFAPSLFMGSYTGFLFAKLINVLGFQSLPVGNFTIVGMAGILSGVFHAPLTAIFLIAEITGGYDLIVPLMMVSSISLAVAKRFEKHSLDVKSLAKKGQVFTGNKDSNILTTIDLNSLIIPDEMVLKPDENLQRLVEYVSHSSQSIFAVTNQEKELIGLIYFDDIREIIFSNFKVKYTKVQEIMKPVLYSVQNDESMAAVMNKFDLTGLAYLPVLYKKHYKGFISKQIALEAYRDRLKALTID